MDILIGVTWVDIVYDSTFMLLELLNKTKLTDGSVDTVFISRIALGESQMFNIWKILPIFLSWFMIESVWLELNGCEVFCCYELKIYTSF